MRYEDAVAQLYALGAELAPVAAGAPRRKFELEHMRRLATHLGDPQKRFPSVLIAGTNGKGSTAATLASILACAGYRTGLYTSPHLQRVNERIQMSEAVAGQNTLEPVSDADFAELFARVSAAATELVSRGELPHAPSYFETLTAMAFLAFAEAPVEVAVLEVGMGGRLDATNIVEPRLSVITDISLDHTEWLGTTLSEIAREKAGILREGGHMVILPQHPEVNAAIGERAVALGVTGINAAEFLPAITPAAQQGPEEGSALAGQHQLRNRALALAASGYLARNEMFTAITPQAVETGLRQVRWPGRLERIRLDGVPVLLDVAHNPAGAWALRSYLSAEFERGGLPGSRLLIFSAYRDKAVAEMAQILFPLFEEPGDQVWLVPMAGPRAASLEELAEIARQQEVAVRTAAAVAEVLEHARRGRAGSVVITGSVHLIGDAKDALDRNAERQREREAVAQPV